MPLLDRARIDIAELVAAGYTRDQAMSIALTAARPVARVDAIPDRGHAHMVVHAVALSMTHGTAAQRRAVPKQGWPHALEAQYADRIVKLLDRMKGHYTKLVQELPRLLERAQGSRSDSARMDAAAELETRRFAGFDVVVENDVGTTRSWIDTDGTVGRTLMKFPYGYLPGTLGADGEPVDTYLGDDESAPWVYVIHQLAKLGGFIEHDEDKVMIGFRSADAAARAYNSQYSDPRFFGGMSQMSIADFRAALERDRTEMLGHRLDAGEADFAQRLITEAATNMRRDLTSGEIEKLAEYFARSTSQAQRRALARQLTQALGVDVLPDESHIPQLLEYFTHENATLIGSIPEDLHQEVAKLTARAFTKRMKPDTFASLLQDRFDVAESRARFIARDQLGKLWGQLNAVRQRSVGVDEFTWRCTDDDKVRPLHRRLANQRYSYENPPIVARGERMLPGEDYGCRCEAVPVVDGIVAAAKQLRGHRVPVR
jgi:SPP1 gp7 family putative phage head morphogenesis protein